MLKFVPLSEGDFVRITEIGAEYPMLDIPGLTRAYIAYYGLELLFCGDTLF